MLRDLSLIGSSLLALLLVVLTPVGTGQGAHRDQLLDLLFPHVHFADGSTSLNYPARDVEHPDHLAKGPALGAGAGATTAALSVGLTPPLPGWPALMRVSDSMWRIVMVTALPAGALADPPPDPPPTAA